MAKLIPSSTTATPQVANAQILRVTSPGEIPLLRVRSDLVACYELPSGEPVWLPAPALLPVCPGAAGIQQTRAGQPISDAWQDAMIRSQIQDGWTYLDLAWPVPEGLRPDYGPAASAELVEERQGYLTAWRARVSGGPEFRHPAEIWAVPTPRPGTQGATWTYRRDLLAAWLLELVEQGKIPSADPEAVRQAVEGANIQIQTIMAKAWPNPEARQMALDPALDTARKLRDARIPVRLSPTEAGR